MTVIINTGRKLIQKRRIAVGGQSVERFRLNVPYTSSELGLVVWAKQTNKKLETHFAELQVYFGKKIWMSNPYK